LVEDVERDRNQEEEAEWGHVFNDRRRGRRRYKVTAAAQRSQRVG
jgi:hypothetical protein